MPSKAKPSVKPVILQAPSSQEHQIKRQSLQTLDSIWHLIITYVMEFPDACSDADLWREFRAVLPPECSYASFKAGLQGRQLPDLRRASQNKATKGRQGLTAADSIALTQQATASLKEKRRKAAIMHVDRMDRVIDRATTVLESESQFISEQKPEAARIFLSDHLQNANSLHKLAKSVYDMDGQSDENNAKVQLNVLMNFDPHAAVKAASSNQSSGGDTTESEPIDI